MDRRTLAIAVNARNRCGLDPMLVGNIITTLNLDLRRGEAASSIAERIRHNVDHFADEHCDMRINQQFLDAAGAWRAARCVSTAFNPARWNPIVSNQSGFGVYRIHFEDTFTSYCTPLMKLPVAGLGALVEGADGRGLVFQMSLPPKEFEAMSSPANREHMHRFRCAGDDIPRLHREVHGYAVNCFATPRPSPAAAHGSRDTPRRPGRVRTRRPLRSAAGAAAHPIRS